MYSYNQTRYNSTINGVVQDLGYVIYNTNTQTININPINATTTTKAVQSLNYNEGV